MKNLKKVLALVLVVAMMMTFAVSASAATYKDQADISYNEAVEVMSAIKVLEGTDGSFNPQGTLTREQAAKIIAFATLGKAKAEKLTTSVSNFSDVEVTRWSAPYIEYCYAQGIIGGVGNNKFNPTGKLTGTAFAKMLLVAIGYDETANGLKGASWAINTAKLVNDISLDAGMTGFALSAEITREEAAQLALNAMNVGPTKEVTTTKYVVTGISGTFIAADTAAPAANKVIDVQFATKTAAIKASVALVSTAVLNTDYVIDEVTTTSTVTDTSKTLLKKVFGVTRNTAGSDAFGRPATTYTDASSLNLVYAQAPVVTYTSAVTAAQVKADLGVSLNASVGTDVVAAAANGKTVEVYKDGTIVAITPTFGTVTVSEVKATRTRGAYTNYSVTIGGNTVSGKVFSTVVNAENDVDNAFVTGTVKNGDKVLAYKSVTGNKLYISAVETVKGAITAKASNGTITLGGEARQVASGVTGASNVGSYGVNKNTEVEVYIDANGYLLAPVSAVETTANYALLVDGYAYATMNGNKVETKNYALIVTTDGELVEVLTAADLGTDTNNGKAYTYTVNPTTGVYTFTAISGTAIDGTAGTTRMKNTATAITNKATKMTGDANSLLNGSTKFFFVNYDKDGKATGVTEYTGINAVPSISAVAAGKIVAIDTSKTADAIADIVFVNVNTTAASTAVDYVYYMGTYVDNGTDGIVIDVIKGGEQTTMTVANTTNLTANTLYKEIKTDGTKTDVDGKLTKIKNVGGLVYTSADTSAAAYNDTYKTIGADVPVYVIDKFDDSVVTMTGADLTTGLEGDIYVTATGTNVITAVYVIVDTTHA